MNNDIIDPAPAHETTPARGGRASDLLVRISVIVGGAVLLAMVANVFSDISLRTAFNLPIQGTNQFVSYWWMLPLVFFGLAAAQRHGEHTDLPIVYDRLPRKGQAVMTIIALICTAILVALIGWFGLENAFAQAAIGEYDASTGVSTWPPRFAVPVACLIFLAIIATQLVGEFKSLTTTAAERPVSDIGSDAVERNAV